MISNLSQCAVDYLTRAARARLVRGANCGSNEERRRPCSNPGRVGSRGRADRGGECREPRVDAHVANSRLWSLFGPVESKSLPLSDSQPTPLKLPPKSRMVFDACLQPEEHWDSMDVASAGASLCLPGAPKYAQRGPDQSLRQDVSPEKRNDHRTFCALRFGPWCDRRR